MLRAYYGTQVCNQLPLHTMKNTHLFSHAHAYRVVEFTEGHKESPAGLEKGFI